MNLQIIHIPNCNILPIYLWLLGNVSSDGAVQVKGQIDGDLNCTSLTVLPMAFINGGVKARS